MASIPEGHARSAMDGRRWKVGTDEWPTMGGWDRWTTGKRGEIPGEDDVQAARGRGREFSASTKPTPVCAGFQPEILPDTHAHRRGGGWFDRKPRFGVDFVWLRDPGGKPRFGMGFVWLRDPDRKPRSSWVSLG
jgi:hypothetical protein